MLPPMFLELVHHGVRLFPCAILPHFCPPPPWTIPVPSMRAGQVRRIDRLLVSLKRFVLGRGSIVREKVEIDTVYDEGHGLIFMAWGIKPPSAGKGLVSEVDEVGFILDTLLPSLSHVLSPALPLAAQMRQLQGRPVILVDNCFLEVLVDFAESLRRDERLMMR